jgi:hypothetical protein
MPPPKPMYYRLCGSSDQAATGTNPDDVLESDGHTVEPVESDPDLLQEARFHLRMSNLSGLGLRKLIPSNRPRASRLVLELRSQIELIQPRRQLV